MYLQNWWQTNLPSGHILKIASFFTRFHDLSYPLLLPVAASDRKVLSKEKRSTGRNTSAGEEIGLVRVVVHFTVFCM